MDDLEALILARVFREKVIKSIPARFKPDLEDEWQRLLTIWQICLDYFLPKLPPAMRDEIKHVDLHQAAFPKVIPHSETLPNASTAEIILLLVRPSTDASSILRCQRCRVRPQSIHGASYSVLSYVWGDPSDTRRIELDGRSTDVAGSLDSALRHLRHQTTPRLVWADPLCINHANGQTGGSSTENLRYIYSKAQEVIVWLGNSTDTSAEWFKLLDDIAQLSIEEVRTFFQNQFRRTDLPKFWSVTKDVLEMPWWDRAGIVLHLMHGCKVTVQCGNASADWKAFMHLFSGLQYEELRKNNPNIRHFTTFGHAICMIPREIAGNVPCDDRNTENFHNMEPLFVNLERIFSQPKMGVNWVLALFKIASHLGPMLTHLANKVASVGIEERETRHFEHQKRLQTGGGGGYGDSDWTNAPPEDCHADAPTISPALDEQQPHPMARLENTEPSTNRLSGTAGAGAQNPELRCWLRILKAMTMRPGAEIASDSLDPGQAVDQKAEHPQSIHETLDQATTGFRIILLNPSDDYTASIDCEHIALDLDYLSSLGIRKCPFTVIEHNMAEPSSESAISLRGSQKTISSELLANLRRLRHSRNQVLLWTEALCTDQDSPDENAMDDDLKVLMFQISTEVLTQDAHSSIMYRPLSTENLEIRVIHILPASDPNAIIKCALQTVSLRDEEVTFKALSYVWGDPAARAPIVLNGEQFSVTVNLEAALKRFRDPIQSVILWADAICINQADLEERGQQVQLMGFIYTGTDQVLAWLGDESEDSDLAMDMIEQWGNWAISMKDKELKNLADIQKDIPNAFDRDAVSAIQNILQRPFWNRIWIVQEVVLAKELDLVCGTKRLPWNLFIEAFQSWVNLSSTSYLNNYTHNVWSIFNEMRSTNPTIMMALRKSRGSDASLLALVGRCMSYQATDPRDKIFGLLGVATDAPALIRPDYKSSVNEVYRSFTRAAIEREKRLEVIREAGFGHPRTSQDLELPSWVPDWSGQREGRPRGLRSHYRAGITGGNPRSVTRFRGNSESFWAIGTTCGRVSDLQSGELFSDGLSWISFIQDDLRRTYRTGIPTLQAFFRIILLDTDWEDKRLNSEAKSFFDLAAAFLYALGILNYRESRERDGAYKIGERGDEPDYLYCMMRWLGQNRGGRTDQTILEPFLGAVGSTSTIVWPAESDPERGTNFFMNFTTMVNGKMVHRCIFKTRNGYMGVGPVRMEKGDIVVVLLGCSVPVLLRKVNGGYILIGECFVLGLMDGEAIDNLRSGEAELKKFTIL
ncbi:heterokaryon incompatibility protein-domain-containing protein [Cladorrhinum sp. PSN259]|nr:heterokaryon incompatibility protein-domain-containing protein [Cladorrhinum sp. PSN259]